MKAFFTVIAGLSTVIAFAQAPYLYFNRITSDNGLSHNKVNCILQDRRGFIWLGTEDGLNRYDGQNFRVFRNQPNDSTTLSGNIITDMLEDEYGILWIATSDGGLTKYDYRLSAKKQFKQYKHIASDPKTIPVNIINKMVQDKYGYLWLATSGAYVLRFNKKTETFESPVRTGTRSAASLAFDEHGILWVGRIGESFLKLNVSTLKYESDYDNLYDVKLRHSTVTSLLKDSENNIWYGSWDKVLYRYNARTHSEEIFQHDGTDFSFPNDEAQFFAEDLQHRVWIAGKYFGLTIYDKDQNKFFNYRNNPAQEGSIADNSVNFVYMDRSGSVWLGTNKGVSICNLLQKPFVQTFLPSQGKSISIYDFYQDADKKLWLGTSEGIFMQSPKGDFTLKKIFYNKKQLAVSKFFKDSDGTFYLGTQYSLFVYDEANNTVSLLPNTEKDSVMKDIISSRVVSIIRDTIENHPVLLVSPYGHYITYYDLVERKWISRTDSVKKIITNFNLRDNLVRKFYKTRNGHIWLAQAKYGLGDWQKQSIPRVSHLGNNPKIKETIANNNIYDILEDTKGNLWISTYGAGLNYFNTGAGIFTHLDPSNNLMEGIQSDQFGKIWMVSNGNLDEYDPRLNTYASYHLPDLEKSGGVKGYIFKDADNNFYVSGTNYFIKFDPSLIKEQNSSPKVYFTDLKIFNASYPELLRNDNIRLHYFQNYFSLEFAAPQFNAAPVQYSYMLSGVDKDWVDAGDRNFANYSNLAGGQYTFRVRASNKKGNWGKEIASLTITIIPPFWKQWWFFALCAIAVIAAIFFFYRYRINELLKRQAIRNKIAQDLHDSMGSTLSSISVYSQVAKIYNNQEKKDQLQDTLNKIGETSGEMIKCKRSFNVWNPMRDLCCRQKKFNSIFLLTLPWAH